VAGNSDTDAQANSRENRRKRKKKRMEGKLGTRVKKKVHGNEPGKKATRKRASATHLLPRGGEGKLRKKKDPARIPVFIQKQHVFRKAEKLVASQK